MRAILGRFLYQGWIFRRAFEKPRGYPGDYQIIEAAYNNVPLSGGLGRHLDRYCLDLPYTVAIRNRKDYMRDILFSFVNTSRQGALRILNLASGG